MVDIYNEQQYIKVILDNGLSDKWRRDTTLLARYYRMDGRKKKDAYDNLFEKCKKLSAFDEEHIDRYNMRLQFRKVFNKAWNNKTPLRIISKIDVAPEVLDWFLNLPTSFCISSSRVQEIKALKHKTKFKVNPNAISDEDRYFALDWNEVKYLWTLYIWCRVQGEYYDSIGDLPKYMKIIPKNIRARFKEDANLGSSFNLLREQMFLEDIGLIGITNKKNVTFCKFIEEYPVFQTPINPETAISLKCGENLGEGDLYKCGYFLQKKKMGSFICAHCGNEFAYYNVKDRSRKYCKECRKIIRDNISETATDDFHKILICEECGKEFEVRSKNSRSKLCPDCQNKINKKLTAARVKAYRERQKEEM